VSHAGDDAAAGAANSGRAASGADSGRDSDGCSRFRSAVLGIGRAGSRFRHDDGDRLADGGSGDLLTGAGSGTRRSARSADAPAVLDQEYLAKVRQLEERLRAIEMSDRTNSYQQPALTKALSVVDALDAVEAEPALAALSPSPELRYQAMAVAIPSFMGALRS